MKYLKMKARHVFIETMVEPIIETLEKGPIDLIVGKFNEDQRTIRAVVIVTCISVDNEEAFKCQGLSFGAKCRSNCRLCTMPTKDFYTFSTLSEILEDPTCSRNMSSIDIIDTFNNNNLELFPIRDSVSNIETAKEMETIWWKQVLFNKNKRVRGDKKLKLSNIETHLLNEGKSKNLKPFGNNIMTQVLSPFYTRFGQTVQHPIIQMDLCFPPDKLHSFDKGIVEYTIKYMVSLFILYQKQEPLTYGNNMSIIDQNLLKFDIFQPISYWGNIPPRRIPGLSGKLCILIILYLIYFV
jgi:hypothetical protein